jgi:hypothetical protein
VQRGRACCRNQWIPCSLSHKEPSFLTGLANQRALATKHTQSEYAARSRVTNYQMIYQGHLFKDNQAHGKQVA